MKKLLGIVVLVLICCVNSYAENNKIVTANNCRSVTSFSSPINFTAYGYRINDIKIDIDKKIANFQIYDFDENNIIRNRIFEHAAEITYSNAAVVNFSHKEDNKIREIEFYISDFIIHNKPLSPGTIIYKTKYHDISIICKKYNNKETKYAKYFKGIADDDIISSTEWNPIYKYGEIKKAIKKEKELKKKAKKKGVNMIFSYDSNSGQRVNGDTKWKKFWGSVAWIIDEYGEEILDAAITAKYGTTQTTDTGRMYCSSQRVGNSKIVHTNCRQK